MAPFILYMSKDIKIVVCGMKLNLQIYGKRNGSIFGQEYVDRKLIVLLMVLLFLAAGSLIESVLLIYRGVSHLQRLIRQCRHQGGYLSLCLLCYLPESVPTWR